MKIFYFLKQDLIPTIKYLVKTNYNDEKEEDYCFKLLNIYHVEIDTSIIDDYIINVEKIN